MVLRRLADVLVSIRDIRRSHTMYYSVQRQHLLTMPMGVTSAVYASITSPGMDDDVSRSVVIRSSSVVDGAADDWRLTISR